MVKAEPSKDNANTVYIGVSFTDDDEDLVDWINMLISNGQSPRTWIRAILVADETKKVLDAGTVCSIPTEQNDRTESSHFFGTSLSVKKTGWEKRGVYIGRSREFVIGSILTINSNNKIIVELILRLQKDNIPVSQYVKICVRKYIHVVTEGESIPPNLRDAKEILTMATAGSSKKNSISSKETKPKTVSIPYSERHPEPIPEPQSQSHKKQTNSLVKYIS